MDEAGGLHSKCASRGTAVKRACWLVLAVVSVPLSAVSGSAGGRAICQRRDGGACGEGSGHAAAGTPQRSAAAAARQAALVWCSRPVLHSLTLVTAVEEALRALESGAGTCSLGVPIWRHDPSPTAAVSACAPLPYAPPTLPSCVHVMPENLTWSTTSSRSAWEGRKKVRRLLDLLNNWGEASGVRRLDLLTNGVRRLE